MISLMHNVSLFLFFFCHVTLHVHVLETAACITHIPRPHPLMRRNGPVNHIEFLGL